jgi:hypothetical protein
MSRAQRGQDPCAWLSQQSWRYDMSDSTYRLTSIHRSLDEAIRDELRRRLPDSLKLLRLKRLKLAVKDRLSAQLPRDMAR